MDKDDLFLSEAMDERIDRFLKGEMSNDESERFKKDLAEDAALAQRAKVMAVLIKSMQTIGERKDRKIIESIHHSGRILAFTFRTLALAASVALLIGLSDFFMERRQMNNIAAAYMAYAPQKVEGDIIYRGEIGDSLFMAQLTPVINNVERGVDIKQAISQLSDYMHKATMGEANVYYQYADWIGYNLAIAQLKNHDKVSARATLVKVLEIYPNYVAAKNLLNEIDKIDGLW